MYMNVNRFSKLIVPNYCFVHFVSCLFNKITKGSILILLRFIFMGLVFFVKSLSAQTALPSEETILNLNKIHGNWNFISMCGDSSLLFVNNAKYSSDLSIYFYSDSLIYWNIPFDRQTSCHGGSNQYQVAYYLNEDTLFIEDEYTWIPDQIRACFKLVLQGDTGLCLTRIRTLPSVYNHFRRDIFYASSKALFEWDSVALQQGPMQNAFWEEKKDSLLLLYQCDTLVAITHPDTCIYAIITIYHPKGTWQQPLSAIKNIPGYAQFNQFRIIGYPLVFRSGYGNHIFLSCKLNGLPDKYNDVYLSFYLGKDL